MFDISLHFEAFMIAYRKAIKICDLLDTTCWLETRANDKAWQLFVNTQLVIKTNIKVTRAHCFQKFLKNLIFYTMNLYLEFNYFLHFKIVSTNRL